MKSYYIILISLFLVFSTSCKNANYSPKKKVITKNKISKNDLYNHFVSIEIYALTDRVGASKEANGKQFSGAGGGQQGTSRVLKEPVIINNGKVYFKYEFRDDSSPGVIILSFFKCHIDGNDILKTAKGKKLKINAECIKYKTTKEYYKN